MVWSLESPSEGLWAWSGVEPPPRCFSVQVWSPQLRFCVLI